MATVEDQVQLGSGYGHHCAIDVHGVTECWGADTMGQAVVPNKEFRDIAGSDMYTCGVDENQRLDCWGFSNGGTMTPPAGYYTAVSLGAEHGCG